MKKKHNRMQRILAMLLSLVLVLGSVCGNGSIVATAEETATQEETSTIKVACVGDSLTEGYLSTGGKKGVDAYPARLQKLLGSNYEVKNFGKTGYTLLKGTDVSYWNSEEYTESIAYGADVVIIMLGTNDSKSGYWNETQFKTDAKALVDAYSTGTNRVIFATSPQCYVTDGEEGKISKATVDMLYEVQKALVAEYQWDSIDMYAKTEGKESLYHTDKVHFTDEGYYYIAQCMYEAITGEKAPIEETVTIPHTQTTGETNYFTYSSTGWSAMGQSSEHVWSDAPSADSPSDIWYEVTFTGHAIDVYAGKNRPMGMVSYYIDGVFQGEYSLYNGSNINSTYITTFSGLTEGEHTFKAVATGKKDTNSTNTLIDCAEVVVYSYREPEEARLHGSIVDSNLQYTQAKYKEVKASNVTEETLVAWKNDTVVSEIALASVDSEYKNVTATVSDFTGSAGTIRKDAVSLQFIKSVDAYTGMPGYGNPDREVPTGSRAEANEVLYQDASVGMNLEMNQLQNIWVSVEVPKDAKAGTYTGTVRVNADGLETPLTFTYTLVVADVTLPDATEVKDGFDIELWQNPYRVAEYYDVEPFSEAHFEILKPHMELYKEAGGHAVTTTIVEEAWAGQTYGEEDVKYPSMVQWTKKADGTWVFDYSDFDAWVTFNKEVIGIGDKIVCYSIAPWTNAVVYYDEATQQTVSQTLTAGTTEWTTIWTAFLNDLADHLYEKGWFEDAYIGIDERGFSAAAFDLIDSIERGVPTPSKLKSAGAMDGFVSKRDLALRVDDLNVGSIAVKAHPTEFEEIRQAREEAGLRTTVYTCTGHIPGSFSLSAPAESYWTMMYAYSVGGEGYLRWAYDSWVEDPLTDTTHNAFEAGDCFLVFPDETDAENPTSKSSTRFEKMAEGVRDVNKLIYMKTEVPSMTAKIDALLSSVKATYASSGYYLTDAGKAEVAADMNTIKESIATLTEEFVALKATGISAVTSVTIAEGENLSMIAGHTVQLTADVLPANVLDNTLTWTSSNDAVATVKDGLVTALQSGTVVITATSNQNKTIKASITITISKIAVDAASQYAYYSFDDVTGTTLNDEWGSNAATLDSTATTAEGKSGQALSVTEASKGAVLNTANSLSGDWTIAYWVKTSSSFDQEISVLENAAKTYSFSLKMASDRASGFRVGDGSGDVLTFQYGFAKDTWYHLTWVQDDASGLSMYVNGQLVSSNAWTKSKNITAPFDVIGGTGFTGLIDEVKVYNRVLTAEEVASVMQVKGLNIADSNPSVYVGEVYQISADLVSDNADKTITYTSSNPEIASVDANGLVTAHKKGKAIITVENVAGGFKQEVTVNCIVQLYSNSRIPQYELDDAYLTDIQKSPNTDEQYLGQPDMVRTKTGRLITAYPVGHGHGPIIMQMSDDDGETWTRKTDIPASWAYCQETPTLYILNLADGTERIMLISACPSWDLNKGGWETSYSDDNGETWTEYSHFWSEVNGSKHATIVAMSSLIQLKDENGNYIQKWMGVYHNYSYVNYKTYLTFDENGNEQWSEPVAMMPEHRAIESSHQICEIGLFRSPDGSRIVGLARSQTHAHLSTMFWSDDEGETWSEPIEVQGSLAGERHKAVYDPISGRLVITFREIVYGETIDSSWMAGDWVAWVGTYEDLMNQGEGDYRILIEQDWSMNAKSGDTGYAGIVVLEDGTFIMDSYGHFDEEFSTNYKASGSYNVKTDLCYIKQAKFKLGDIENDNGLVTRESLEDKVDAYTSLVGDGYTADTWTAFEEALAQANAILKDTSAQQVQVDEALANLEAAYAGLCKPCTHTNTKVSGAKAASCTKDGYTGDVSCATCGVTISKGKTIARIKKVSLKTTSYTYNGKTKKPSVVVKDRNGKTIAASNYQVKYGIGCKAVGRYKVTITFKGNYTGTVKTYFKILPKAVSLKSVKASKKALTVKWAKQSQANGYQIQYATNKSFTKGVKSVLVKKNKTTSTILKKLKAKKTYYVRVRAYKTVKGTKYYSAWSKVKKVKTK